MDILLFYFLAAFGVILFFFAMITRDAGLKLSLSWLVAAIFICTAILLSAGEEITSTTVFDETTSVTTALSYGLSTSNIVILFVLFGIVSIVLGTFGTDT